MTASSECARPIASNRLPTRHSRGCLVQSSRMRILTYSEAFNQALCEEMARDLCVVLIGKDVGAMGGVFGVTAGLVGKFDGARVMDTSIREADISGATVMGIRPMAEIMFGDFLATGDQLINHVAKTHVPLTIRGTIGAPGAAAAQHLPRTPARLDVNTRADSVKKTGRTVIVREAHGRSGPSADIAAVIAGHALDDLDTQIQRLADQNVPLPNAPALRNSIYQWLEMSPTQCA